MEPLVLVLVAFLAADVGLIGLNRTIERDGVRFPGAPDAVREVPGGLLRDAEVAVQLHARYALEVGGEQVGRDRPRAQRQLRAVHDAPSLDRKVHPAVIAAERLRLASRALADVERTAAGAGHAVRPARLDEPGFGRSLVENILTASTSESPSR